MPEEKKQPKIWSRQWLHKHHIQGQPTKWNGNPISSPVSNVETFRLMPWFCHNIQLKKRRDNRLNRQTTWRSKILLAEFKTAKFLTLAKRPIMHCQLPLLARSFKCCVYMQPLIFRFRLGISYNAMAGFFWSIIRKLTRLLFFLSNQYSFLWAPPVSVKSGFPLENLSSVCMAAQSDWLELNTLTV